MSIIKKTVSGNSKAVFVTQEECKQLCDAIGLEYHAGLEKRIIAHTITDESQDRSGDVVLSKGVDTTNYYPKNPMVMAFHDYHNLPVGSCVKVWHDPITNSVKAYTLFYDNKIDPTGKSDTIYKMVNAGAIKGVSIGFKCNTSKRPKNEEERKQMGVGEYGRLIESCELVEYSMVPIPDNSNALTLNSIEGISKEELEIVTKSIESYTKSVTDNIEHSESTKSMDTSVVKEDNTKNLIDIINKLIERIDLLDKTVNDLAIEVKAINNDSIEIKESIDLESLNRLNNLFKK